MDSRSLRRWGKSRSESKFQRENGLAFQVFRDSSQGAHTSGVSVNCMFEIKKKRMEILKSVNVVNLSRVMSVLRTF